MLPCPILLTTCHQLPSYPQPVHYLDKWIFCRNFVAANNGLVSLCPGPGWDAGNGNTNELCKNAHPTIAQVCAARHISSTQQREGRCAAQNQDRMVVE